jgi:hypothetical protein
VEHAALIINFRPSSMLIGRVYDLYGRLPEKRAALDKWAEHIERIVRRKAAAKSAGNVVSLRRARMATK